MDLILKSTRLAYPNMESDRDDYAVMHEGAIVGRIVQVWHYASCAALL
jgi:hypothetical protein